MLLSLVGFLVVRVGHCGVVVGAVMFFLIIVVCRMAERSGRLMTAWIERVCGAAKRPPRRAAPHVVHRLGRTGPMVRSVAFWASRGLPRVQSSLGPSGSTAGGVRSSTAVSVVSPCAVIPLGEPVLVLLVLTPVSQRAVWQCGLVVGGCVCFRGSRGRGYGRGLDQLSISAGNATVSAGNGPRGRFRGLGEDCSTDVKNGATGRRCGESGRPETTPAAALLVGDCG